MEEPCRLQDSGCRASLELHEEENLGLLELIDERTAPRSFGRGWITTLCLSHLLGSSHSFIGNFLFKGCLGHFSQPLLATRALRLLPPIPCASPSTTLPNQATLRLESASTLTSAYGPCGHTAASRDLVLHHQRWSRMRGEGQCHGRRQELIYS